MIYVLHEFIILVGILGGHTHIHMHMRMLIIFIFVVISNENLFYLNSLMMV